MWREKEIFKYFSRTWKTMIFRLLLQNTLSADLPVYFLIYVLTTNNWY